MIKNSLIISICALVAVTGIGGFMLYGFYQNKNYSYTKPVVTMEIEGYGTVKMELYPDKAPNTVKNFIKLINEGYYNGLTFHRVEEMLIQGGDKNGDGTGSAEVNIDGEFTANGFDNDLKFERGTVGLARADYTYYSSLDSSLIKEGYNSGYAQFFIMTQAEEQFDGLYTAFGKVTEGIEIVDTISKLETKTETDEETGTETPTSMPVNPPVIKNISVETFGENYGEPKTHETFDINGFIMQKLYGITY